MLKSARSQRCWGAMCVTPRMRLRQLLPSGLLILCALLLPLLTLMGCFTSSTEFATSDATTLNVPASVPAKPSELRSVCYRYPQAVETRQATYAEGELLRGKLLLIDAEHPIPADAPVPNTICVASHGKGMIPVRDLTLKSSRETIDALYRLFYDLRQHEIEGLAVSRGTLSAAEQREWQLERMRVHARNLSLNDALAAAQREVDEPGASEHQQGYAVDIRLYATWNAAADAEPIAASTQGRYLLQQAWRYGFVQRYPESKSEDKAYHFRYVGVAHSTAMTYLGTTLEAYLSLLHERRVVQIHKEGAPRYLIVCEPIVDGYATFSLPEGAECEVSADNLGYAVAACAFPAE